MATAATKKPAVKYAGAKPVKKKSVAAPVAPARSIPYHYNIVFEMLEGKPKSADGILTVDAPVMNQTQYEGVKAGLVKHFDMEGKISGVVITALNRLDTINLMPVPAAV